MRKDVYPMSKSTTFPLHVVYEESDGGTVEYDIVADQRDAARWEAHPKGGALNDPAKQVTLGRFLAWSACQRQRKTKLPWAEFDKELVEATHIPDEEWEARGVADAAHPGPAATSAAP